MRWEHAEDYKTAGERMKSNSVNQLRLGRCRRRDVKTMPGRDDSPSPDFGKWRRGLKDRGVLDLRIASFAGNSERLELTRTPPLPPSPAPASALAAAAALAAPASAPPARTGARAALPSRPRRAHAAAAARLAAGRRAARGRPAARARKRTKTLSYSPICPFQSGPSQWRERLR
ncbi:hypothetical protein EVAR_31508_1 [Eumeta japonica]|uniref:Uncharacterized protein n=1 Tax=Eumeta variegata TaxID=151549 RepID=A0A4C1YY04_EUMVA|nr:hypothetical protein EVAR_31508_1 [Eumeta japonica]